LVVGLVPAAGWAWGWYRARQEWQDAQRALRRHDLPAAAAALERYLRRRPDDVTAWFLAGRTARRMERFAEAERALERCQGLGGVTDATRLEWDLLRVQQGDLGEIDARLRMTVGPDHPDAGIVLECLARGYIRGQQLRDAIQACALWQSRDPEDPGPWLWRGRILERLGRSDEAQQAEQRAVDLAPEDPEARLALGNVLLQHWHAGDAAGQFRFVLDRSPDSLDALVGLAECHIARGEAAAALPLLDRVLTTNPSSPAALFLRGQAALELDDRAAAETWLRRAVKGAPDNPQSLYLLIQCLRGRGRDDEAAELDRQLAQLRKDLARLGDLVREVARKPDDAATRGEAGALALKIGRREEGLNWLLSALRARGDHGPAKAALADYYREHGDPGRAETP
jgi:tetratricopeptide (TPR) repeat protein